jgi:hypothetical protein
MSCVASLNAAAIATSTQTYQQFAIGRVIYFLDKSAARITKSQQWQGGYYRSYSGGFNMTKGIKIDTDAFWQNGYLLIRDVFSKTEVEELRKHVIELFPNGCGDILSKPFLREVLLDDRILDMAQKILGGKPVYFGDSSCVKGKISYGWHKDNADRRDANAPDWQSKYTLIRFGLYLQDHSKH